MTMLSTTRTRSDRLQQPDLTPAQAGELLAQIVTETDPTDALWEAIESGFMVRWVPEVPALAMQQDPIHRHKDVLSHSIIVTANTSPRLVIRLAALFHDVGKPRTRRFEGRKVSFHHHEVVGARMARSRLAELEFDPQTVDDVARLVELSGRFHGYQHGWEDSAVRRYARDAGPLLGDLNELVRCDCTTRHPHKLKGLQDRMDHLEVRIRDLARQDEEAKVRPALNGEQVMKLLGVGPGPVVGQALAMLLALKRQGVELTEEEARERVIEWSRSR